MLEEFRHKLCAYDYLDENNKPNGKKQHVVFCYVEIRSSEY